MVTLYSTLYNALRDIVRDEIERSREDVTEIDRIHDKHAQDLVREHHGRHW